MPKIPVGQTVTQGWPVLDLGTKPKIPLDRWGLRIDGAVARPVTLRWDDFRALEPATDISDFHCVTTWSRMDLEWDGVRFATVLAAAEPLPEATHVMCHADDGYTTNLALEEALKDDVLLVHTVNGESLPVEHGGPVRVITPQLYAWKGAKWVNRLELLTENKLGFWEERGYSNTARPWRNDPVRIGGIETMTTFAIEFESAGLCVEVRLNGVRVYRETSGVPRIREDRVNHWMVPGENVLGLWLGLPRRAPTTRPSRPSGFVGKRTRRAAPRSGLPPIGGITSSPSRGASSGGPSTRAFRWKTRSAHGPGRGPTGRAHPRRPLGDRGGIVGFARRGRPRRRRRGAPAPRAPERRDGARPRTGGRRPRPAAARILDIVRDGARWRLEPLDPATLLFAPHADGKLVSVSDRHGLPGARHGVVGHVRPAERLQQDRRRVDGGALAPPIPTIQRQQRQGGEGLAVANPTFRDDPLELAPRELARLDLLVGVGALSAARRRQVEGKE